MSLKLKLMLLFAAVFGVVVAYIGQPVLALGWILLSIISLLGMAEHGGANAKIAVTTTLGIVGLFIFIANYGIKAVGEPGDPGQGNLLVAFDNLAHAIHLEIFLFLFGLYVVVNSFAYSGIIGDLAWRIVKGTKGKLTVIMPTLMVLTAILSGIFDGATIASIMGVITLTILLSAGMPTKNIVGIMLLLVIATNIGGVWFVLGEPTNVLAADKLGLSPVYFLLYAAPFAVPSIILCAIFARRLVKENPFVSPERPETEVLLEGVSLRRVHAGSGSLIDTLKQMGTIDLKTLADIENKVELGMPDFEAALAAGVPKQMVYASLEANLNSKDLAEGLVDYYQYKQSGDPRAKETITRLLEYVRNEYKARKTTRWIVIFSGFVLIGLLTWHALDYRVPTWSATVGAAVIAIFGVRFKARRNVLSHAWHDLYEALFLVAIFATIYEINKTGAFETLGAQLLNLGSVPVTGVGILVGTTALSAVADNIAVMDVITNIIPHHPDWSFFALASIVGTALGGFLSPIASVQAIILATLIRRVAKVGFGQWVGKMIGYGLILLVVYVGMLLIFYALGIPAQGAR